MDNCIQRLMRARGIKMKDICDFLNMSPFTVRGMINSPLTIKIYERDALATWLQVPAPDLDEIFHENKETLNKCINA